MTFTYTPSQEKAVHAIYDWFYDHGAADTPFTLGGYAGTGKSTLIPHILKHLGIEPEETVIVTYTGRAVGDLEKKAILSGSPLQYAQFSTIHGLIYRPSTRVVDKLDEKGDVIIDPITKEPEQETKLVFQNKRVKNKRYIRLIIVDESYMVPNRMIHDLMKIGVAILKVGDPGQLPPVEESTLLPSPDARLTDIVRQAADNKIIEIAWDALYQRPIHKGIHGKNREVKVVDELGFNQLNVNGNVFKHADIILCGKNKTRHTLNELVRQVRGFTSLLPEPGDQLICLYNNKQFEINSVPLSNGSLHTVETIEHQQGDILYIRFTDGSTIPCNINTFGGNIKDVDVSDTSVAYFDFGYAITVHKAQGGEWDNVVVFDESHIMRQMANRWLYTAITRAGKSLILVQ